MHVMRAFVQKLESFKALRKKGPVSPQRRMLHTGTTAVALLLTVTALCVAGLVYGLWVCWRHGYPQVRAAGYKMCRRV